MALFTQLIRPLLICIAVCVLTGCGISLDGLPYFSGPAEVPASIPQEITRIEPGNRPKRSGHRKPVVGLALLPGSPARQLLSVDAEGSVLLWDLSKASAVELFKLEQGPDQVSFLPERRLLAAAHLGNVRIVDLDNGKVLWSLTRLKARITTLAFQSDARALIVGGADGRIYRWKFLQEVEATTVDEREKSLERYVAHSSVVSAIAPHPFGRAFFSGDWKGILFAWLPLDADGFSAEYAENLFGGRFFSAETTVVRGDRPLDAGIALIRMSGDGNRFVVGTQDGWIEVWRVKGFKKIARFQAHRGLVYALAVDTDGTRIVSVGRDGTMRWNQIDKDPKFGLAEDSLEYRHRELAMYTVPRARLVELRDRHHVISCKEDGTVIEVSLSENAKPLEEIEEVDGSAPGEILDTDY